MASRYLLQAKAALNGTQPVPPEVAAQPLTSAGPKQDWMAVMLVITAVFAVATLSLLSFCLWRACRRRSGTRSEQQTSSSTTSKCWEPESVKIPVLIVQPDSEVVLAFTNQQLVEGQGTECRERDCKLTRDLIRTDSAYNSAASSQTGR